MPIRVNCSLKFLMLQDMKRTPMCHPIKVRLQYHSITHNINMMIQLFFYCQFDDPTVEEYAPKTSHIIYYGLQIHLLKMSLGSGQDLRIQNLLASIIHNEGHYFKILGHEFRAPLELNGHLGCAIRIPIDRDLSFHSYYAFALKLLRSFFRDFPSYRKRLSTSQQFIVMQSHLDCLGHA